MNKPLKIINTLCLSFFSVFFLISFAEAASCGSANGSSTVVAPTSNLCSDGSSPYVLASGNYWTWSCGSTSCSATDPNAPYKSQFAATEMPSYTGNGYSPDTAVVWLQWYCDWGFPTTVSTFQNYTQVACEYGAGQHGGCIGCVMSKFTIKKKTLTPVNGSCGSANGKTYAYNVTGYGSDTQCSVGSSSNTAFPAQGGSTSWTCSGSNGGSSASCWASRSSAPAPVNGSCGSANGGVFSSAPTSGFCNSGTFSGLSGSGPWSWTCSGSNGGSTASCSASKTTSCGSANGSSTVVAPTSNLCSDGSSPYVLASGNYWTWSCGSTSCSATDPNAPYKSQFAATEMPSYTGNGYSPDTAVVWLQWYCSWGFPSAQTVYKNYDQLACEDGSGHGGCVGCVMSKFTIRKKAPAVNGSCGSANGKTYAYNVTGYGSDTQCSVGSSSNTAFPAQGGSTSWTCSGSNGGSSASCWASRNSAPVNGSCGSANGKTYAYNVTGYGSDTQCASGSSNNTAFPAQGSSVYWACSGSNGGSSVACSASRSSAPTPVNGVCGSSNGANLSSAPTTNLCSSGTATIVLGTGPWTWSCSGSNGGSTASCSANLIINGSCGSANGKTYAYNVTGYGSDTQCSVGSSSNTAFPSQGGSTSWTCSGSNGGSTASCSASRSNAPTPVNGTCGSSNGANLSSAPTTNLCSVGSASAVSGTGPWSWTCSGSNGGSTASCSANLIINGSCGSSNGANLSSAPTTNLCSVGSASAVSGTGPWSWTCSGQNTGTTASCSANLIINGLCGSANGKTYAYNVTGYGSDTQCSVGSSSNTAFPAQGGSTSWTCSGSNGGTTANCSASRNTQVLVNGVCGVANGTTVPTAPTTNLCSSGTATAVLGTGPWSWTCSGSDGGSTASCNASKSTNGLCGASKNGIYSVAPTTGLCSSGASSSPVWNGSNWAWVCRSCNGGYADFCYAYKSIVPVCGSSHGTILSSAPTTNLCSIGIPSAVLGTGPWSWTCNNGSGIPITSCGANNAGPTCYFCCH